MNEPSGSSGPTPVPDDRVHGDSLSGGEPYGDSWLRPTLASQRAESPAPPPPPAPSARRWWLVAGLGATLVLASAAGVTTWGAATGGLWHSADEQQTYRRAVTDLTFAGGSSDVEVRGGGPAGTVHLERHLSWGPGASRPAPKETWAGSDLTVDAGCGGAFLSSCSIDYVVTVPDATTVIVRNGSGDVTVSGALGGVSLDVGSGDIDGSNLDVLSLTAKTDSGDVDLELAGRSSPVVVRTGSGDVSVRLAQDAVYAVDTETRSGDTEVGVPTNPSSVSSLQIRTGSGDISVDRP